LTDQRRILFIPCLTLVTLLLSALACNAPGRLIRPSSGFSAEDLRQTVEAMPLPGTPTPAPGSTPDSGNEANPTPAQAPTPFPTAPGSIYQYETRPGDTLASLARRFSVEAGQIFSPTYLNAQGYLPAGTFLSIPDQVGQVSPPQLILPDSELVYSPAARDFNVQAFVDQAGGYLAGYQELLKDKQNLSGGEIIQRVANELSLNPRLLLGLLEMRSGWVFDHPPGAGQERYPLGFGIAGREGLYEEVRIAATQLNLAYYGWREGSFQTIHFQDGGTVRLNPTLNSGTAAIMHLFTLFSEFEAWVGEVYGESGFAVRYRGMFGEPWAREALMGPLLPADLAQPTLELPFRSGEAWALTAGPHNAWNAGTPLGALDLSPIIAEEPCATSSGWVTAAAPGVAVRTADNAVALDLDGDGYEGTGWVLVYYHIAEAGMVAQGAHLDTDARIGHPSCEGGQSTGTHVHFSRKYNGEWLAADGPVPFVLSGWQAVAGERIYTGQMVRGGAVVNADPSGRAGSTIQR
jgi:LysM repeat protein